MPGKMCHDVSGDKKSIGNWQMETAVSRDGLGTFWHQAIRVFRGLTCIFNFARMKTSSKLNRTG